MAYIAIACAFFAFAILIMAAALAHHLNHPDGICDDPNCQCQLYAGQYDVDDEPLCEGECNADGAFGECTKCGYLDYLAQSKAVD